MEPVPPPLFLTQGHSPGRSSLPVVVEARTRLLRYPRTAEIRQRDLRAFVAK